MDKKIALITGASRGIGQNILKTLSKEYIVIGTGTGKDSVSKINQLILDLKADGKGLILNNDPNTLGDLFNEILSSYNKGPDILINNAGITSDTLFIKMSEDKWQSVIETNLNLTFKVTQTFIKQMIKNKYGKIVFITSVVGHTGNPGQTNYVASKSALIGFSKSLAIEVASRNINVNCISPGFISTDMTDNLNENQKDAILTKVPMKKLGKPDDISNAVLFLVSDKSSYITGETIHVNGGLFMP